MSIYLDDRQTNHTIDPNEIREKAQIVLNALKFPDAELSIVIVDDDEITALNKRYLDRLGPTNVIAFPMREGRYGDINPGLLGDVVISADTASREAKASGIPTGTRFDQLLVHGILHLLGYDHENDRKKATVMEAKEKEMLKLL